MAFLNNNRLQSLHTRADFERDEEVKEIEKAVKHVVDEIGKFIGKEDPLFKNHILCSGSFYENLKVEQPDEFDFMLCLDDLSVPGVCRITDIPRREVRDPGYILVHMEDTKASQRWKSYMSRKQNLKSNIMLERFKDLVSKAFEKISLPPKLSFNAGSVELRKIPVTFQVTWSGKKYSDLIISVDLPLCIYIEGWPADSDSHISHCPQKHLGYEYLKKATSRGYHLVASCIGESGRPRPCWRLSFSIPEGILLKEILANPESVHRASIMALKVLRNQYEDELTFLEREEHDPLEWQHISFIVTWVFHSYAIKTTFLYEWFEHPDEKYWRQDKLAERVRSIIGRMKAGLERKDIRSFWIQDYKLFNFKARKPALTSKCCKKLEEMMASIAI